MLKLPELIQKLSNEGCTDIKAMEIATDLVKAERAKRRFAGDINETILNHTVKVSNELTDTEMKTFSMLADLSERERECYLLHTIEGRSLGNIAKQLGIAKSSVQTYVVRARKKVFEKE